MCSGVAHTYGACSVFVQRQHISHHGATGYLHALGSQRLQPAGLPIVLISCMHSHSSPAYSLWLLLVICCTCMLAAASAQAKPQGRLLDGASVRALHSQCGSMCDVHSAVDAPAAGNVAAAEDIFAHAHTTGSAILRECPLIVVRYANLPLVCRCQRKVFAVRPALAPFIQRRCRSPCSSCLCVVHFASGWQCCALLCKSTGVCTKDVRCFRTRSFHRMCVPPCSVMRAMLPSHWLWRRIEDWQGVISDVAA